MQHVKKIYLYLVSVITLIIMVWGAITLVNMALKAWVFTKADNYSYFPVSQNPEVCDKEDVDYKMYPECIPGWDERQKKAEEDNRIAQRQRDAAQSIAMILIAAPVWYFHWRLARKEQ